MTSAQVSPSRTMRGLVFTAPGTVELQDLPQPLAGGDAVVIDVKAAGICGSELHGFRNLDSRTPPLVMGHEFAGISPDGRRVVVNPLLSCGNCDMCRRGQPQICRHRELLGVQRAGGFAERAVVPISSLLEIPDGLAWESASLVEPLANAVHAWRKVGSETDIRAAVIGAGTIGLVCTLWARRTGLTEITVVDRSTTRLALADRLGATAIAEQLAGEYDVIIDAVGSAQTRHMAISHLRPGGTTVWLGLAEGGAGFDGRDLVRSEKLVIGSFAYTPADFATALGAAGDLDLSWTTSVSVEDSAQAFMSLAGGASEPVKAVIRF
ncbi:MAG: alcohol dehydrogenase catalytic domain-containing protein [Candidatus Nanopelagicales bacterium]